MVKDFILYISCRASSKKLHFLLAKLSLWLLAGVSQDPPWILPLLASPSPGAALSTPGLFPGLSASPFFLNCGHLGLSELPLPFPLPLQCCLQGWESLFCEGRFCLFLAKNTSYPDLFLQGSGSGGLQITNTCPAVVVTSGEFEK